MIASAVRLGGLTSMLTTHTYGPQPMSASLQCRFARDGIIVVGAIFRRDLDDTELAEAAAQLSADECAHLQRIHQGTKRLEYVYGRLLMRHTLAHLLGAQPRTLTFREARFGKPYLEASSGDGAAGVAFNLSHAGGHIILGISQRGEIGIDIEVVRDYSASVAGRYFHEDEKALLEGLAPASRARAFYRLWTAKEACVKALGIGLGYPLHNVPVTLENTGHSAGVSWRRLECEPAVESVVALQRLDSRATLDIPGASAPFWVSPYRLLLGELAPADADSGHQTQA